MQEGLDIEKMNKNTKKTSSETGFKSTITLGVMIIFMLFLTGFVSAWEWDNVKNYDIETKTATITNAFDFPLISSKIADVQLKSEQHVQVGLGYQKVFEYTIDSYVDYNNFIQELEIYNLKAGNVKENKKIDLKYLTYETIDVPIYETTCKELEEVIKGGNSTDCTTTQTGTEKQQQERWIDIEKMDVKTEKITISGWTEVNQGDYYEWIPNFAGIKVQEWATWSGNMSVGLVAYYKFDETSGTTFYDSLGYFNATKHANTTIGQTGKIGYSSLYNKGGQVTLIAQPTNLSFSYWFKGAGYMVISNGLVGGDRGYVTHGSDTNDTNWYHVVGTKDGDVIKFYLNGALVGTNNTAGSNSWGMSYNYPIANRLSFLKQSSGGTNNITLNQAYGNGQVYIDEVGIWNRTLTATEVTLLYNDGDGCAYGNESCFTPPDASPTVTLNSPVNAYNTTNPTIPFNCSASDDIKVQNVSLLINGTIKQTNSSGYNNTWYAFSETITTGSGFYNWTCRACDNSTAVQCTDATSRNFTYSNDLTINLNSPVNSYNSSSASVTFNGTASDDTAVLNVSLILDGAVNQTNSSGYNNTDVFFTAVIPDGDHNWTYRTCDAYSCTDASARNLSIDTVYPIVNTAQNITNLFVSSLPTNSTWNYTATDSHISTCYYNTTDHAETIVTCNSSINTKWATEGNKQITYCANDTFGLETCNTISVRVANYSYSHSTDKSIVGEGDAVTFTLRVNGTDINTEFASTNATLSFNGVVYSPDTTTKTAQNYSLFEKTLSIPSGSGNSTGAFLQFNWTYNIKNTSTTVLTQTTNTSTLKVLNVSITDCGVTAGRIILNMSLKDEELKTLVNETAPNVATIEVDLTISSETNSSQTWNFHKQWDNNNTIAVCVPNELLNETSYNIEILAGYESTDHVREFWYLENGTLDNTNYFNPYTYNVLDLFDLASADSTTFLFSFTNTDGLEVDDAIIHTFRKYIGDGEFKEVERSKQDNNGETHVHLVEEDVIYYFMITQYGTIIYTSDEYNAKCLSTPCAITLTASPTETNWSMIDNEGGLYSITADKSTRIVNLNFDLGSSDLVNFSLYKFTDGTAELVNTSYLTASTGSIDLTVPLSYGNSTFFVSVFRNNSFVKSEWVSLKESGKDYFGTFGAVLGGFLVLAIMLMAVSEGAGFIVFTAFALIIIGIMQLVDLTWLAIGSIICAGGLIVWKLMKRRNKQG
jgi:hypothetical protein